MRRVSKFVYLLTYLLSYDFDRMKAWEWIILKVSSHSTMRYRYGIVRKFSMTCRSVKLKVNLAPAETPAFWPS